MLKQSPLNRKRQLYENIQYNVIPVKDFMLSTENGTRNVPNFGTSMVPHSRNLSEATLPHTRSFGVLKADKPVYLETMKVKSKQNKKLYTEEFEDLKVKKEVHYTNYLHEQTRKIFLNDLDDLKKKYQTHTVISPKGGPVTATHSEAFFSMRSAHSKMSSVNGELLQTTNSSKPPT